MAENKKSIIIYADWMEKFEALSDDEAGRLIKHFFKYVNDLNPEYPDRMTEIAFIDIKNTLKRDLDKWKKRAENSRINGQKGGRPINPEKPRETQQVISEPRKPVSVSVNDSVSVNVINNIPTLQDFLAYAEEKLRERYAPLRNSLELKYQSWVEAGWKDGYGSKIVNWKSKLLNVAPHLKAEQVKSQEQPTYRKNPIWTGNESK